MNEGILHSLWLSLCCKPDSATFINLIRAFKTPTGVFMASDDEITKVLGTKNSDLDRILLRELEPARVLLEFCTEKKIGLLPFTDERYPNSLREIDHPPALLYYRGILPDFNHGCYISIVGTRSMSDYGKRNAFRIARDLAVSGATVVSGMARGIDAVAAAGAIYAKRPTVAVLGCGINICYPKEHLTLARQIVKNGCILTEYPPNFSPSRYTFPQRNRIISGLSQATIVIEGEEKSGSLITARFAQKQGRVVYALPGSVDSKNSQGPALLIRNGARVLTSADDVIRDLEPSNSGVLNPFVLKENEQYPVDEVLNSLEVLYIKMARRRPAVDPTAPIEERQAPTPTEEEPPSEPPKGLIGLDAESVALYQRIPFTGEIAIEDLMGEGFTDVRKLMKYILKLEMAKLIKILPGERVSRNIH